MSNQLRSLDRITIPTPCDADWDSMAGNDQIAPNGWARTLPTQAGSLPGKSPRGSSPLRCSSVTEYAKLCAAR